MIERKLVLNTSRKPLSLFQILSLKLSIMPLGRYIDDIIFGLQENLIISETVYHRWKFSMELN